MSTKKYIYIEHSLLKRLAFQRLGPKFCAHPFFLVQTWYLYMSYVRCLVKQPWDLTPPSCSRGIYEMIYIAQFVGSLVSSTVEWLFFTVINKLGNQEKKIPFCITNSHADTIWSLHHSLAKQPEMYLLGTSQTGCKRFNAISTYLITALHIPETGVVVFPIVRFQCLSRKGQHKQNHPLSCLQADHVTPLTRCP